MPADVQDVLKLNIVFVGLGLLSDPAEVRAFSQEIGSDVELAAESPAVGFPPGAPAPGRKFALLRDRISIALLSDRTVIERELPTESDLDRLAEVVGQAVKSTSPKEEGLKAFGYNLEMVYNQSSGSPSLHYLGKCLFDKSEFALEGWTMVGGAGRLSFDSSVGRWNIRVEPRFNDETSTKVFLSLNLHKTESQIPTPEDMRDSFAHIWEQAHAFVKRLDENVS